MNIDNDQPVCCSFCDSHAMSKIIDFGKVALAGAFLQPEQFDTEIRYPLRLCFCEDCFAVQVIDKINPEVLFKDYFYFSSSIQTLKDHFREYAVEVTARFLEPASSTIVEFGCNDGILLRPFADENVRTVIGVDPASNVVETINDSRITIINDFFNETVAQQIVETHGKVDMVVANNVYAHIPDIQGTTRAVSDVLNDDGVFVFEVHYLGKVINELQYDMIYHEHLYYYSLLSAIEHFNRYDLDVFDVKPVPIHAGSMRFYICKKGSKHAKAISSNVLELKQEELKKGFNLPGTFTSFAAEVANQKKALIDLLTELKRQGHTIAGYGASGRANTMIQYCEIDHTHLDYMIDDAPSKAGFYTPGSHFKIHPGSILESDNPPDFLLLFAWSFADEITKKNARYFQNGGKIIVPLPEVQIVSV